MNTSDDTNQTLTARNHKLAALLKESRDKLSEMREQLEELAEPPSTYGVFLNYNERTAEIVAHGRRMRVHVTPNLSAGALKPGALVRLGEGNTIVDDAGYPDTGSLVTIMEKVGHDRAIVTTHSGEEHVVYLADPIRDSARAGDTLLADPRAGYAFEVIEKTEVSQLSLDEIPDVTWADIGGLDDQIEEIRDAIELPFNHPELYRTYDLNPPKGILLYGPPGVGKTLIAKAIANQLGGGTSYFLNVKGPELLNKYVGETERRIRLIFERAREMSNDGHPVVVFFDEMESIFRTRGSGVSSDIETTVVPQLLTELDGVESLSNVIVIGATNREELIDPAILRPGRLDLKVRVARPDREGARQIFSRYLTEEMPRHDSVDKLIAAGVDAIYTDRPFVELKMDDADVVMHYRDFVSGAMIANVVDRAKKEAIKDHIAGRTTGLSVGHVITAVETELKESGDLPNTADPDAWARIAGIQGSRITEIKVVG